MLTSDGASIRIGTASWSIPKAAAVSFPSSGTILQRYAAVFDACEINSTFYRSHKPDTYKRWAESVPDNFLFSVKLPRFITHERRLDCEERDLAAIIVEISNLGSKLGPLLIQLPPSLRFDATAELFIHRLRQVFAGDAIFEPRHKSWFNDEVFELLAAHRIARAAVDPATGPGSHLPSGFAELTYFRLHGSPKIYHSDYGPAFIDRLHHILQQQNASKVWCIFDNTALGFATSNALALLSSTRPHK